MSNTKIVIDKAKIEKRIADFGVLDTPLRRVILTELEWVLNNSTEIQIDQTIEGRAEIEYPKVLQTTSIGTPYDANDVLKVSFIKGATSQQIVEQLRVKEKEPIGCEKEWVEKMCENCEFLSYDIVGHPGGSSVHTAKKHYCTLGHFQEDF